MESTREGPRFAVLIDADNAQAAVIDALLSEVAKYGIASVKRAYGDWSTSNLNGWKEKLNEHAIQPIQQFRYTTGKNATDSALIIDAMDLLYTGHLGGFCIVSSDSDFTRLATRLREAGMLVLGFGEKKTPSPFVKSCDKFIYTEVLRPATVAAEAVAGTADVKKDARALRADKKLVRLLRSAVESSALDDGWAHLGRVGALLVSQSPDFDPRNYGYARLLPLLTATELFEIEQRTAKNGQTQHLIRAKRVAKPEVPRKLPT
jgi:uncharacterized LabA/DUF88 family protein